MEMDRISEALDYITHKENQTEKDLFTIKKNLQIVK